MNGVAPMSRRHLFGEEPFLKSGEAAIDDVNAETVLPVGLEETQQRGREPEEIIAIRGERHLDDRGARLRRDVRSEISMG